MRIRSSWKKAKALILGILSFPLFNIQREDFLSRQIVHGQNRKLGLCVSRKGSHRSNVWGFRVSRRAGLPKLSLEIWAWSLQWSQSSFTGILMGEWGAGRIRHRSSTGEEDGQLWPQLCPPIPPLPRVERPQDWRYRCA